MPPLGRWTFRFFFGDCVEVGLFCFVVGARGDAEESRARFLDGWAMPEEIKESMLTLDRRVEIGVSCESCD